MKLLVTAEGSIRCLYAEAIDLSTLGRQQILKLHVFKGDKHPHQAQQPKEFTF